MFSRISMRLFQLELLVTLPMWVLERYSFIAIQTKTSGRFATRQRSWRAILLDLAIIFALTKFFQCLFGRHRSQASTSTFGSSKPTYSHAANRLAQWASFLSQFDYVIEYRKTSEHTNAVVLSRLPAGEDSDFDRQESADVDSLPNRSVKPPGHSRWCQFDAQRIIERSSSIESDAVHKRVGRQNWRAMIQPQGFGK